MDSSQNQVKESTWHKILFDEKYLNLPKDVLNHQRKDKEVSGKEEPKTNRYYINEILVKIALSMNTPVEALAIPQLLHTASSLIFLESTRDNMHNTLKIIREAEDFSGVQRPFEDIDPSTVITVAALYFLISDFENSAGNSEKDKELIRKLQLRLDKMNWLIGLDGVNGLGIIKMK